MKVKFRKDIKKSLNVENILNFNNSQNYIIDRKRYLAKYISNIDDYEKEASKRFLKYIFYSFILLFFGIFYGINFFQNNYFLYGFFTIIIPLLLFIFLSIFYILKFKIFRLRRYKKYTVKKISPRFWKILYLKK